MDVVLLVILWLAVAIVGVGGTYVQTQRAKRRQHERDTSDQRTGRYRGR